MPSKDLKLLWLPGIAGILSFASFPKTNQGYLAWIALIPLIAFVCLARTATRAFWGGYATGAIQFFGLLVWIPEVLSRYGSVPVPLSWVLYLLMVAVLACYPGVVCLSTRFCMNRCGDLSLLTLPVFWVAMEYLRNFLICGGFPWLQAGYSQTQYLTLIQIADLAGVYGVTFLLLWINTALACAVLQRSHSLRAQLPLFVGVILMAATMGYGKWSLRRWGSVQPNRQAALLQANISFDESDQTLVWKLTHGYAQMADRLGPRHIDLMVLPESPSPLKFQEDESYRKSMEQLAHRSALGLVFNSVYVGSVDSAPLFFNSAYFLSSEGKELGRYDKIHLVPFGEYVPWKVLFSFAETISKDVGDFSPGRNYTIASFQGHPANVIICFEAIFPNLVRKFVREGSQLIVNLTNDGWYGDTAAPYQHLEMARWRAVENRRYLLRAANSGISAIIEPTGIVQVKTGLLREDMCVGQFSFIEFQSIYTRRGDVFAILCVMISCAIWVCSLWRGRRRELKA